MYQRISFLITLPFILSWSFPSKKDALDTIRIFKGNQVIAKWTEFDDSVQARIVLNAKKDTLTFWCSTDSGWMDSTSLFLTVEGIQRNDLFLSPLVDSSELRTHFFLPTHRIPEDIETIEVWRKSGKYKKLVFQLSLQREHRFSSYCECIDTVYQQKTHYLDRVREIVQQKTSDNQTTHSELLAIKTKMNQAEERCLGWKQSPSEDCLTKVKLDSLNNDIELIHRVIEMNAYPRGCNEIEHPKE